MDEGFEFSKDEDGKFTLDSAVFQALGAASMCWSETPKGEFDGTKARMIGEKLINYIRYEWQFDGSDK